MDEHQDVQAEQAEQAEPRREIGWSPLTGWTPMDVVRQHENAQLHDRIDADFTLHAPQPPEALRSMESIRARAREFAHLIADTAPHSRPRSLALTKLEEVVFWANAAIARSN